MLMTGKEALNFELENTNDDDDSLFYKLEAGDSVSMVFLGGLDGILSWLQHNWWKVDRYSKNPNEQEVSDNVIFTSLKTSWTDPDTVCPGSLMGSEGEQKYGATVLVQVSDGKGGVVQKEKIFFFGKAIWNGITQVYRDIQAEFGNDDDIGDKWLRLSNSGNGPNRYSVTFMGKFFKEHATYTPKHDVKEFIKTPTFHEIVVMMRNAGLPIDDKLAEHNLDENGNVISS